MVKFWEVQREKAIKLTKYRIKHLEKHGNGASVITEKARLQRQEKHHRDRALEK